jgi:hypothetical protein
MLHNIALPFSSCGSRAARRDFHPCGHNAIKFIFQRLLQVSCYFGFLSCASRHGRVKERSSDLPLLVKPNEPISGIRLSSGISHIRKQMYRIDTSARFGLQQLFDNLHDLCQMEFSLTFFGGLPFWYLIIRLLLSCCQPLLYPDQNPFAGSGLSFHN